MSVEPKISIIVPVYKVEPYLRKCLDSIVNQTYRNLQIILVDDGSPDNCGKICDEYAARDRRIEVIHQENGGVSAARNAGLNLADGDYIGWVDSDDWIEPGMYGYLLENALKYGADIAVCSRFERYKNKSVRRGWSKLEVLNREQALEMLLENDCMQNYLWDKLWRKDLFADIVFPEGKTYEDISIMHKLFIKARCVVCLPDVGYNYFQRADSIVSDVSLQGRLNHYAAAKNRYDEMIVDWPQFENLLLAQCVASAVCIWSGFLYNLKSERKLYRRRLDEVACFCKQHCEAALKYMKLGLAGNLVVRLTPHNKWWAFALAALVGWLYKLKHGRNL